MINLALIGVGAWGKNYVSTCKKLSNVRIKYLCAKTEETLNDFQGDFIKTNNYKDLFKYPDIDGVIIATPNATHHEISYEFLKRGFNVLVEKPMSEDYFASRSLLPIQKKNGAKFQVGHIYLFDPAYKKTKELVQSIGKLRYIDFVGTNNGPLRKGTSALWDIGSHAISLCLDISQKNPKKVSAWANTSVHPGTKYFDFTSLKLELEDGIVAYIKVSWLFPVKKRELVIVGEKDSIMYDAEAKKKVIFYKNMYSKLNLPKITYPKYSSLTPLEIEINEFVQAIKKKKVITQSGLAFGIKVTKVLNLAERSIAQNGKAMNYD